MRYVHLPYRKACYVCSDCKLNDLMPVIQIQGTQVPLVLFSLDNPSQVHVSHPRAGQCHSNLLEESGQGIQSTLLH